MPDYLICLKKGKRFKSLKRHVGKLGMTPDEYPAKWGLPNYAMVAPNYAAIRSAVAEAIGFGTRALRQADQLQLMDHTALSPVESETATLAPIMKAMQLQPVSEAQCDAGESDMSISVGLQRGEQVDT